MTTVHSEAELFTSSDTEELPVSERLRQAMEERGMKQFDLARLLAGEGATEKQIESKRRSLNKWLGGTKPGRANALKLAGIFDRPMDYFSPEPSRSSRGLSEIAELAIEVTRDLQSVDLPRVLTRKFIADELILGFHEENILISEVDDYEELERATGFAELGPETLRLGEWYRGSTVVPGLVIFELLSQIASVALLTDPVYRKRMVYVGSVNHFRIRKIVRGTAKTPARLRVEAKFTGFVDNGRIAQYETYARFADTHELVARAQVWLSTTR